jgi:hypothetical protein
MRNRLHLWWTSLSNVTRATFVTSIQAGVGSFLLALLSWLGDLNDYVNGDSGGFPSPLPLARAGLVALTMIFTAWVTFIHRTWFAPPPRYNKD